MTGLTPKDSSLARVKRVYAFWGRFPALYRAQDFFTFLGKAQAIRRRAVEKMGLKKGAKVLEIACGTGRNFPFIFEAIGERGQLTGTDYSQEMLDAAAAQSRREGWKNVTLIRGDAADLRLPDGDYDGLLSVLGISAVPRWEQALARCREALRVGGRLVVCDARLFRNSLSVLNPLIKLIYSRLAAWDPSKDIPEKMRRIFSNVEVESFNFGTFFIAVSVKR